MGFWTGDEGKFKQVSNLSGSQRGIQRQLENATRGHGAGGAFGNAADYYRSLLSDNPSTFQQMVAPEMRRFNEQIIPDLAEQFAGMGSGGLESSGFRNAAVSAGTDLSERLGAIRAQLRQQGAQGLTGIGQQSLVPHMQNIYQPGTGGALQSLAPAVGTAVGAFGGPIGAAAGGAIGNWISGFGKSSPYGSSGAGYDQEFRMRGLPT